MTFKTGSELDFAHFGGGEPYALIQKKPSLAMKSSAASSGRMTGPKSPGVAQLRIASLEWFLTVEVLPHLICFPSVFRGGSSDEAGEHGNAG